MKNTEFIYVGTEIVDGVLNSHPIHAFYSPVYDKMWCFVYQPWENTLVYGSIHDLGEPFGASRVITTITEPGTKIFGMKDHPLAKNIEQYKVLFDGKETCGNLFPVVNTKEVWAF